MKTILVPTDFSPNAHKAAEYAATFASNKGQTITLLHSFMLLYAGFDGEKRSDRIIEKTHGEADERMQQLVSDLQQQFPDLSIQGKCIGGYAADNIIDELKNHCYSLVVMGTKGAKNTGEKLLGSTTFDVVSRSDIPVLAIPEDITIKEIQHVGFFTNYTYRDTIALLRLHHVLGSDYVLHWLHLYLSDEQSSSSEAEKWSKRIEDEFSEQRSVFRAVRVTSVGAEVVNQIAEKDGLDLLIFSRPKRSFFSKLLSKSLTQDVANNLAVPSLFIND